MMLTKTTKCWILLCHNNDHLLIFYDRDDNDDDGQEDTEDGLLFMTILKIRMIRTEEF